MTVISKAEDAVLTLTNNKKAYTELIEACRLYYNGHGSYGHWRGIVFKMVRIYYDGNWSNKERITTTHIAYELFNHYYEEVSGRLHNPAVPMHYYISQPYWAQKYMHEQAPHNYPAPSGSDKKSDCFYCEAPTKESTVGEICKTAEPCEKGAKPVETKTFIFGRDVKLMKDEEIFGTIQRLENEITGLETIQNKPKKLTARIDELKANIAAIVAIVDAA